MSVFGAGNLMLTPLMVVCLDDVLQASELVQVAVTSAVPIIMMPLVLQPWAAFLDRHHVIVYRSVHAWVTVGGSALLALAVLLHVDLARLAGVAADGHVATPRAAWAGRWATTISRRAARKRATWPCTSRSRACAACWRRRPRSSRITDCGGWLPGFETVSMLLPFAMILAGAFLFMAMRRDFTAGGGPDATR